MIQGIFRSATIKAAYPKHQKQKKLKCGILSRDLFKKFAFRDRLQFAKRNAVVGVPTVGLDKMVNQPHEKVDLYSTSRIY